MKNQTMDSYHSSRKVDQGQNKDYQTCPEYYVSIAQVCRSKKPYESIFLIWHPLYSRPCSEFISYGFWEKPDFL